MLRLVPLRAFVPRLRVHAVRQRETFDFDPTCAQVAFLRVELDGAGWSFQPKPARPAAG
jgi:hypothetical protein